MSEPEQGRSKKASSQADAQRDLAGLLGGLLGGQLPQGGADFSSPGQGLSGGSSQDNNVANVLGGLLGGSQAAQLPSGGSTTQSQGASSFPQGSAASGGDLSSLLGGLLGGGMTGGQTSQQQSSADMPGGDLSALLGGLLGGSATGGASSAGDMGLGGLLGGLLGGSGASSSGLGGLLGSMIGSDQTSSSVAQQTGLAPTLVQALLPMIMGMLLRGGQRSNIRTQGIDIDGDGIPDVGDQAINTVERLRQGDHVDAAELQSSGLTRALARHSGYSEEEVAPAAVKIMEALTQHNR